MKLRSHHVVMLFVIALVLAGNCLLTSADRGMEEGALPWSPNSLLHSLVEVLNLRYTVPTPLGVDIKTFVFGAGTATIILIAAIGWYVARRATAPGGDTPDRVEPRFPGREGAPETDQQATPGANMSSLTGAQLLFLLLVAYSLLSANWSFAPKYALGGTAILATNVFWAWCLGRGLNRSAARTASTILLVVCVMTAALSVWYFYERNPNFRSKYPIGNPLFLAAVLLPAIVLSICGVGGRIHNALKTKRLGSLKTLPLQAAGLGILLWAFILTGGRPPEDAGAAFTLRTLLLSGSRAALVGLCVGLFSVPFFLLGRRGRIAIGVVGLLAAITAALIIVPQWQSVERFGRGATIRLRLYAWSYASQMVEQRSLTGVGQGGYTLLADGPDYAGRDLLSDPQAFRGRLAHAHNEWIETWADLGTLGLALLVVAHLLTLIAGLSALSQFREPRDRWLLAGLLASLLAMGTEEFADVALRIAGLPAVYYTVLGLIWAMCGAGEPDAEASRWPRRAEARTGILVGAVIVALTLFTLFQRDFAAARAQVEARAALQREQFDDAIEAARFAAENRLEPTRRLDARMMLLGTYAQAARAHLERARQRRLRIAADGLDPNRLRDLIAEDMVRASIPLGEGLSLAEQLRLRVGGQVYLGALEADLCAMLAEQAREQGRPDAIEKLRARAEKALQLELSRNRFDEALALKYLSMARGIPVGEQVEVLCGPLRGGLAGSETFAAVADLARNPEFVRTLQALVEQSGGDLERGDPLQWKSVFSPEICRLAAALEARGQRFDSAIALSGRAIELYEQGRNQELLSLCRARTLNEVGWYAFLRDPKSPNRAREWTEQAVQTVPPLGRAEQYRAPMYAQLINICLASGNEEAAREWALKAEPALAGDSLDRVIGRHYAVISEILLPIDLETSLRVLARAERLAGQDARVRWASARSAFRQEEDHRVVQELERLMDLDSPQKVLSFIQGAMMQRPGARAIRELYERLREQGRLPQVTLAPETPQSQPSTAPALPTTEAEGA